jgi:c-di-GMP-related signal transduction protein
MVELVQELAVSDAIQAGLLDGDSSLGRVLLLVIAYERGRWDRVGSLAEDVGVPDNAIPELGARAVQAAMQAFQF